MQQYDNVLTSIAYEDLAKKTSGYSWSDIEQLCMNAHIFCQKKVQIAKKKFKQVRRQQTHYIIREYCFNICKTKCVCNI